MRVSRCVQCDTFPCSDVRTECYVVPDISLKPKDISIVMISEAAPADSGDHYYAQGDSLFGETTVACVPPAIMAVAGLSQGDGDTQRKKVQRHSLSLF